MPLYVYRCPKCGHEFEALRRAEDRDLPIVCPRYWRAFWEAGDDCPPMERVTTSGSFVVNGYAARNGYAKSN